MRIVYAGPNLASVADTAVAMQRAGHEVAALLPYDASAEGRTKPAHVRFPVLVGPHSITAEILQASGPEKLPCYLFRAGEELPPGSAARGVFHSQVIVELARRLIPSPAVLHLAGWEMALAPAYVRTAKLPLRTVLELRDVANQGSFDAAEFAITRLPGGYFAPGALEFFGRLNFLKGGLLLADAFTVDSWSTYTALRTEPAAHRLGRVLEEQGPKCRVIARPGDLAGWNPATDKLIAKHFSADDGSGKGACRTALLAATGTRRKCAGPVVLMQCHAEQAIPAEWVSALARWTAADGKWIVLADADAAPVAIEAAAIRSPAQVSILRCVDEPMQHAAVAGSDFQIFPDAPSVHFAHEAWRAMRYGTIPMARDHIGRGDSFGEGEGLAWFVDSPEAVWDTTGVRANGLFRSKDAFHAMQSRAMSRAASLTESTIAEANAGLYRALGAI